MPHTKSVTKRGAGKSKKVETAKVRESSSRKSGEAAGHLPLKKKRRAAKPEVDNTSPVVSEPLFKVVHAERAEPKLERTEETTKTPENAESVIEENGEFVVTVDRRRVPDRRSGMDRRQENIPVAVERRQLDRRAKVPRRRQIDPTTCERDYTPEEIEFMIALDEYKRSSGRMFPTCSEILEVIKKLGYEKRPQPMVPSSEPGTSPQPAEETATTAETISTQETSSTSPPLGIASPDSLTSATSAEPPASASMTSALSSTLPQSQLTENPGCGF